MELKGRRTLSGIDIGGKKVYKISQFEEALLEEETLQEIIIKIATSDDIEKFFYGHSKDELVEQIEKAKEAKENSKSILKGIIEELKTKNIFEQEKLRTAFLNAEKEAKKSINATKGQLNKLLETLKGYEKCVNEWNIELPQEASKTTKVTISSFKTSYDKLRMALKNLSEQRSNDLMSAYADIEENARFLTIMLFGRTRAGKSTTMEAFTHGKGCSMGGGGQHTTKEVKSYYFPAEKSDIEPNYPCLRIVDTPGIEGVNGEELSAKAEKFVERSDHIFFLLSDDKATDGELKEFGKIHSQGKGITVLFNIKKTDEDIDLLVNSPSDIFKDEDLEGHKRRIEGYISKHFKMPPPFVIPYHARAAWLSRSNSKLPDGVTPQKLEIASRIFDVENYINNYILDKALYAKIRTPRDLLYSYIYTLRKEFYDFKEQFKKTSSDSNELIKYLDRGVEKARKSIIINRFPNLKAKFKSASDGIPGFVDDVIASGGDIKSLNDKWEEYLKSHGVYDSVVWFQNAGRKDFEDEVKEEMRVAIEDFRVKNIENIEEALNKYREEKDNNSKFLKTGLKVGGGTVGGLVVGGLTEWAILNLWNPTGWVAAIAAVAVGAIGAYGGKKIGEKISEDIEQNKKKKVYSIRKEIIEKYRYQIWSDFRVAREQCDIWLDKSKESIEEVKKTILFVRQASKYLLSETASLINNLSEIMLKNNFELVDEIFKLTIPEIDLGSISLINVARIPKVMTKVLLLSNENDMNVIGKCIGLKGSRIKKISAALGGERIFLVDEKDDLKHQILQALGLDGSYYNSINFDNPKNPTVAYINISQKIRECNIALAGKLLNIIIKIQEE